MSEQHTPAQLAQFADLIGITQKTHPHVWVADYANSYAQQRNEPYGWHPKLPPLDTPAGDDVYLAPFLRWLQVNDWNTDLVARYVGAEGGEAFAADCTTKQYRTEMHKADTATLALLRACQSARVPQIVAIFGEGE